MKITVEGQVMKIREYVKKDKSIGNQADVYVDGTRPTLINSGLVCNVDEVRKYIGKLAFIDFELGNYDGRAVYNITGIRPPGVFKP